MQQLKYLEQFLLKTYFYIKLDRNLNIQKLSTYRNICQKKKLFLNGLEF